MFVYLKVTRRYHLSDQLHRNSSGLDWRQLWRKGLEIDEVISDELDTTQSESSAKER